MKICEISWFKEFECLCGKCPRTCCKGWVIPLSDEDCERFGKERGWLGVRLFFAARGWTAKKFNSSSGTCSVLRRDGLCTLQKQKGHEFIPWTCQSFPRFYRNFGEFEERCLDLSCTGAARLFMKHKGATDLIVSEGDPVTRMCTTNDDRQLMDYLLDIRREMMEVCVSEDPVIASDALFLFAGRLQDMFSKGGNELPSLSFRHFYEGRMEEHPESSYCFPLPANILGDFLGSSLFHIRLRKIDPELYRRFNKAKKYIARFCNALPAWKKTALQAVSEDPLLKKTLGRYLAYYLFQYFLRAYETYSFRRQVALGLCHMNMILLLAVAKEDTDGITEETLADTIAVYNRRAFFNDDIQDQMYRIFENGYRK